MYLTILDYGEGKVLYTELPDSVNPSDMDAILKFLAVKKGLNLSLIEYIVTENIPTLEEI